MNDLGAQKQPHSVNQVVAQAKAAANQLNYFASRLVSSLSDSASRFAAVDQVAVVKVPAICVDCRQDVEVWFDDLPFSVTKFVRCPCGALVRVVRDPKTPNP
jgi:hypothetical protein